ncbi:GyrI-like domain-containing protein [Salinibacterium sp. dk2585]|uniref:GyrI-like domain-containing protein n=1 Tax=Salinibacterium sp. dk2585 TaxID=2603292 RepID=UPI001F11350B|nr:GyrI-like domain-containing protein [Salinibacterium sp. dk2585]
MEKIEFTKTLASYRAARDAVTVVDVPKMRYLMVDGHGDPNSAGFITAIEALYPVAYALKFYSRATLERDYVVPPLEALWWADDMSAFTTARDKSKWHWTVMLMLPEWIDEAEVPRQVERVRAKRAAARLDDVRLGSLDEGRCAQVLHVGAFDDEGGILRQMHEEYLPQHGLRPSGRHHEIYLSDFRRVAPEKQRTILRQPVESAGLRAADHDERIR